MAGFGLQFLNGVGEAQDTPVMKVDIENKSFIEDFEVEQVSENATEIDDSVIDNGSQVQEHDGKDGQSVVSKLITTKNLLIFAAGALFGSWLTKRKKNKNKKNGTEI